MEDISGIRDKLKEIIEAIDQLERYSHNNKEGIKLPVPFLRMYKKLVELYYVILSELERHGIMYDLVKGDDIKVWILKVLSKYGELNISQITESIRVKRGRISRKTVIKKLDEMEKEGLVEKISISRDKRYRLKLPKSI